MFAKSMLAVAFAATTAVAQTASGIPTVSTSAIAAEVSAGTKGQSQSSPAYPSSD